jgi:hypothetical protein
MGVTAVDGQIVNPDGIPVKVREAIIGDTRDMYSGRLINYVEAANRIQDKQALVGKMGGIDVTNTLYKQARYMPAEGWRDWQSERTSLGSVVKNAVGYVIMVQGGKFKVYNPYKAMVGIYSDLEQAKRRVQRDEPKQ